MSELEQFKATLQQRIQAAIEESYHVNVMMDEIHGTAVDREFSPELAFKNIVALLFDITPPDTFDYDPRAYALAVQIVTAFPAVVDMPMPRDSAEYRAKWVPKNLATTRNLARIIDQLAVFVRTAR
jgi:hypothetical protein